MFNIHQLHQDLRLPRLTAVVDIGANPIDGDPPYKTMLSEGLCRVTGFEPQPEALGALFARKGPLETYLPDVVGDGHTHTLHLAAASGMASLLEPDPKRLSMFNGFSDWGKVVQTETVQTRQLDDIDAVPALDYLKIDIQGGELMALRGGRAKLSQAVVVQTEVSFVPLYENQPAFGDIDLELRALGFVPHALVYLKRWAIAPVIYSGNFRVGKSQLLEGDMVYVRDFCHPERMSDEQLQHLCFIAHAAYESTDLAYCCMSELSRRGVIERHVPDEYLAGVGATRA